MSFSGTASSVPGLNLKKFESQDEVDEKRKKRQEEWEKVRQPDEPEECPEQPIDNRCLYDKLEEQKLKKQEHDEKFAFKNQVSRLDADEADFLEFCSERQQEINHERKQEEQDILSEMQDAKVVKLAENNMEEKKSRTAALPKQQQGKRSQVALLAGAVKRKGSEELSSSSKKSKTEDTELNSEPSSTMNTESSNDKQSSRSQLAQVIGVLPAALPGLTEYEDSSDSISTSDDSEFEFSMTGKTAVIVRQVAQHHQ